MKMVTIQPVKEPKSFTEVKFTQEEYKAAARAGAKSVPWVTAMEALKNGKGLYEMAAEPRAEVDVKVGGTRIEDLDNNELRLMAMRSGKTLRKKSYKRSELIAIVKDSLEAIAVVDDDSEIEAGEETEQ